MIQTALSLKTIKDLSNCYNTHAHKFSSTRKKRRPELEYVITHIVALSKHLQKPLRIVELGCGDGRLYRELLELSPTTISHYTGVDISSGLLEIAKNHNPDTDNVQRVQDDMIHYLSKQNPESIDIIVTMASYQHLPDQISRVQYLHHAYRTLHYEGQRISIDRSWSRRMLNKHFKSAFQALKKYISTLGYREWNNLLIPFTDQGKTHYRLYHIQTIKEIKSILRQSGLQLIERTYSSQKGDFHRNIFRARNICFIVQKSVYIVK